MDISFYIWSLGIFDGDLNRLEIILKHAIEILYNDRGNPNYLKYKNMLKFIKTHKTKQKK